MLRFIPSLGQVTLTIGFALLYIPIVLLIIYSFNESRLVTVWAGFSLKWYSAVFSDESYLSAARVTIIVAVLSSTLATVLGTIAALALVRGGRFRARTSLSAMVYAPMVMPEVITGLSLLLMFIALKVDRGIATITVAHATFSLCYACMIVSSRLASLDESLEEAATDLGSNPIETFWLVTLPEIIPAIAAGWLLSLSLSLDDLVIASFVSGPGSSTLPIKIFSDVRLGVSPKINALSTIMISVVVTGIIISSLIGKIGARKT